LIGDGGPLRLTPVTATLTWSSLMTRFNVSVAYGSF